MLDPAVLLVVLLPHLLVFCGAAATFLRLTEDAKSSSSPSSKTTRGAGAAGGCRAGACTVGRGTPHALHRFADLAFSRVQDVQDHVLALGAIFGSADGAPQAVHATSLASLMSVHAVQVHSCSRARALVAFGAVVACCCSAPVKQLAAVRAFALGAPVLSMFCAAARSSGAYSWFRSCRSTARHRRWIAFSPSRSSPSILGRDVRMAAAGSGGRRHRMSEICGRRCVNARWCLWCEVCSLLLGVGWRVDSAEKI